MNLFDYLEKYIELQGSYFQKEVDLMVQYLNAVAVESHISSHYIFKFRELLDQVQKEHLQLVAALKKEAHLVPENPKPVSDLAHPPGSGNPDSSQVSPGDL